MGTGSSGISKCNNREHSAPDLLAASIGRSAWVVMKLLSFVKGSDDVVEVLEDFPCDVAFQAADDFSFALAFDAAAFDVAAGSRVGSHADEHDPPECFVC